MAAHKDVYAAQYAACTLVRKSILPYYLIQPTHFAEYDFNGAEFRRVVAAVSRDFQDLHMGYSQEALCVSFKKLEAPDVNACSLGFTCSPAEGYSVAILTRSNEPLVLNGSVAYLTQFETFSKNASAILQMEGFGPLHVQFLKQRPVSMMLALGETLALSDVHKIKPALAQHHLTFEQFDLHNPVHRGVLLALISDSASIATCLKASQKT
jgi:hypothetical protein